MQFYIRQKKTGEIEIIENIDVKRGIVFIRDGAEERELRLVDVIEDYEWCYDIW